MDREPQSSGYVSSWYDPFLLCAVIIAAYCVLAPLPVSTVQVSLLIVFVEIAVMGLVEWHRAPRRTVEYSLREVFPNATVSWLGTMGGLALVIFGWNMLAVYQLPFYTPLFQVLPLFLVGAPVVSGLFILAANCAMGPSTHGGYHLGLAMLGRIREADPRLIRDYLLMWFVRGFFLPLNLCTLVWTINSFRGRELIVLQGSWVSAEYYLLVMMYAIIIAAIVPGYVFGSRLIRTETTAVSHSWFAWVFTLACYPPFEAAYGVYWFNFNPTPADPAWLQPWALHLLSVPFLLMSVGALIVFCGLMHLWGEAQFGLRSSNLGNRGIIKTGPYHFTKHPVYIAKCAAWFLIWMPFLSGTNIFDDIRLTILWMGVCAIYMSRALAEEQLLASDPNYAAYALRVDECGLFRKLGEYVPPLRFSWRQAYWTRSVLHDSA